MAINKKTEFSESDQELATFNKALGHPARIAILRYLSEQNTCFCGDIVDELPLAQSTVSQHLKELQNAGLIKGSIDGAKTCYCIDYDTYSKLSELLIYYMKNLKNSNKATRC